MWRFPTALPGWRLLENGSRKRLPSRSCRAVISASLMASCVWICFVRLPGAAPGAARAWRLPESSQTCSSRNMTPGDGPQSPGGSFPYLTRAMLVFESMNAQKTFLWALYSHEKRLPKMAPGSQGVAPGAADVLRLPTALPGWRLPKTAPGKRLPEAAAHV